MIMKNNLICPSCGYAGLTSQPYENLLSSNHELTSKTAPPYSIKYGMPSYEVCDCCGYEFGNDDEPGTGDPITFEDYRRQWKENGYSWLNKSKKPVSWSATDQLAQIGITSVGSNILITPASVAISTEKPELNRQTRRPDHERP